MCVCVFGVVVFLCVGVCVPYSKMCLCTILINVCVGGGGGGREQEYIYSFSLNCLYLKNRHFEEL